MKTIKLKTIFLTAILISILTGCASNHAMVMPNKDFKQYKAAYIEILPVDEFNLGSAIIYELGDMGLEVINKPLPPNPSTTDMKVKYSYTTGWDLAKYLKSFQIIFMDAQTDSIVANIAYRLEGNWAGTDTRIASAFDNLRTKLGLSKSRRINSLNK